MLSFFLNPFLLLGLAGIALPVVAHLFSRRKFDVVAWGAMQFLDVSRKTRRKIKLEELLLLLIRIAVIALIALALARPWINSGILTGYQSAGSRDVVLVIDGSNSMSRSDGVASLHDRAKRRAIEFLDTLQPGDTACVIDARDQPVRLIGSPLQDLQSVATVIAEIPPAAGASHLQAACEDAVGILGRCSNGNREIVVLTDRQRVGWNVGSDASWKRFDDVLNFPTVKPQTWVVDVSRHLSDVKRNVAVGRIKLSRSLTVPNSPVRFEVSIQHTGDNKVSVPISVLVDGQKLAAMESQIEIGPNSIATFSRSVQLANQGAHLISVEARLPSDSIPADNLASAVLLVKSAIPVLLVDSSQTVQASGQDTFFANIALTPAENRAPWFASTTVRSSDLTPQMLEESAAYVFANVDAISDDVMAALKRQVASGKGLFVAMGNRTTPEVFESLYQKSGLFPSVKVDRKYSAVPTPEAPHRIAPYSIEAPWLVRFRERAGASLLLADFNTWWVVKQSNLAAQKTAEGQAENATGNPPDAGHLQQGEDDADASESTSAGSMKTIASVVTGDPLLLQGQYGRGSLLLMTSGIDASWNSLPRVLDYVPFLHEAIFQLASHRTVRNVDFGQPLQSVFSAEDVAGDKRLLDVTTGFTNPAGTFEGVVGQTLEAERVFQLRETQLPGIYQLQSTEDGQVLDTFVVNYDQEEHDLDVLTTEDKERLTVNDRLTFVESVESLSVEMYGNESRSELWGLLLWIFLGLLVIEVWMTRRIVQGGYADPPAAG